MTPKIGIVAMKKDVLSMPLEINPGDIVKLKKQHPCGGYEWQVVRTGADIGIVCCQCKRHILLPRSVFERRIKEFISKSKTSIP
jgi:hypothetical protein